MPKIVTVIETWAHNFQLETKTLWLFWSSIIRNHPDEIFSPEGHEHCQLR